MADSWKEFWGQSEPVDSSFHETGSSDLLILLGITHQLPTPMAQDSGFIELWVNDCSKNCFVFDDAPPERSSQRFNSMLQWLRNDLLRNLKREPASEPVIKMLQEAQFRVVN